MKHLKALRLAVSVALMTVAVIGSTVAQDGAVLLYEQNYRQLVGVSSADAPIFRHFYVAVEKSRGRKVTNRYVIVSPFETPLLRDGFSGSFFVDVTGPDRSAFASRIRDLYEQRDVKNRRIYLGLSAAPDAPAVGTFGSPKMTIGKLDLPRPGSTLSLVRFDINRWDVSDGVVSYDIKISYWGRPAPVLAPDPETVVAMASDQGAIRARSY
jgi:hypothetical protein